MRQLSHHSYKNGVERTRICVKTPLADHCVSEQARKGKADIEYVRVGYHHLDECSCDVKRMCSLLSLTEPSHLL